MPGRSCCALIVFSLAFVPGCVTPPAAGVAAPSAGGVSVGRGWPEWTPLSLSLLESREGGTVILDSTRSTVRREPAVAASRPPPSPPPVPPNPVIPARDVRDLEEVEAGKSVEFVVSADGSPSPSFQWRRNGAPIAGATGARYRIEVAGGRDAGVYDCVARNSAGAAASRPFTLVVRTP
jgi:hypothetical protein